MGKMSKIEKLGIQGIRSFDSDGHFETIKFYAPLTLVVGINGSGKTTIIESLKYAVTGILPPGAKTGGAFIHDPALNGNTKSFAQIKLAFHDTKGIPLLVTRNLELTAKKTGRSMKTLEAQLVVDRKGDRASISTRVAELDQSLPTYLGASTAVVENVIFCHQEDSLWPLGDSASLKKKFDEIFEAQKYTKAIKTINEIRKKQNIELGQEKIREEHAKADKEKAARAKVKSINLQEGIEKLRSEIEDISRRMKKAADLADQAHEESEGFAKIMGQLEGKRIEAASREQNVQELRATLKEVSESDEWLESALAEFDEKQQELEKSMKSKHEQWNGYSEQIKKLRSQLDHKLADRGKFQQDKDQHGRQIVQRKSRVQDTAAQHGMRGYDDLSDDRLVQEFMYKIRKAQKDQQNMLDRVKREHNADKENARSNINKLAQQREALQQSKINANRQAAFDKRDAEVSQKKADAIRVDEASKATAEARIEETRGKIEQAQASARSSAWSDKLEEVNAVLKDLEDTSAKLNSELIQATRRAGETAQLAEVKRVLKEKQRSLQTLISAHKDRINSALGQELQANTVEQSFQAVLNVATRDLSTATKERDITQQSLEKVDFRLKTTRDDLDKHNKSVKSSEQKIRDGIQAEPSEYMAALADAEDIAEKARGSDGGAKELQEYFQKTLADMNSNSGPFCRTCRRAFKGQDDKNLAGAKKRVEKLIADAIEREADSKLQEVENELKQIQNLRTTYDMWVQATDKLIPDLIETIKSLQQERDSINAKLEKRDSYVQQKDEAKRDLESMSKTVTNINRLHSEVEELIKQSEELTTKQSQQSGGRTIDDIQDEINTNTDESRKLKVEITRLTSEQERSRTELSDLNNNLHRLQTESASVDYELRDKASHLGRVDDFKIKIQQQRETVEKADANIEQLDPQIATAKTKLEDINERADTKERELLLEVNELTTSIQKLDLLNEQIQAYENRGGDNQLVNVDKQIQNLENEVQASTVEQGKLTKEVNKLMEQKKDGENIRRQYSDNLRYRQNSRALGQLRIEMEQLESHNAEVDRERLRVESEKYTREHNMLSAKQSGLMGEMHANDRALGELLQEFKTDFIDAPKRYKQSRIKVETAKAAVEDLAKYGTALDKAIMKYHSLKMDEINSILDELWRATYMGTDIDKILIRADGDASTGKKSHNYRVMMLKNGTEMDMRGRCSAGQKVLASIIIRLALAECFSANCGIFALDEPTTNLDRPNIEALAKALHGIIKTRQSQSNFQLIVITHDEEFLRHMQCGDFTDYYYRVSRNNAAKSVIHRQDISEVI